jgi:predicted ABC-type ATPase
MIAGPNGSGKTTLTRWLRHNDIDLGQYINPDDIALELEGSYEARTAQAQQIADRRREEYITTKQSFSFETVMSHPSKLEVLVRARQAGFFILVYFVGIKDPQINVERVALRVAQGGHDVPLERIRPRWVRSMNQARRRSCWPTRHMYSTTAIPTSAEQPLGLSCAGNTTG